MCRACEFLNSIEDEFPHTLTNVEIVTLLCNIARSYLTGSEPEDIGTVVQLFCMDMTKLDVENQVGGATNEEDDETFDKRPWQH